jgi:hypothetical protein
MATRQNYFSVFYALYQMYLIEHFERALVKTVFSLSPSLRDNQLPYMMSKNLVSLIIFMFIS